MPNLIGSFREALAADLALHYPDADVYQGERSGRAKERAKASVFFAGMGEQSGRVVVGQGRMIVRYWPVSSRVRDDAPAGVRDPTQLEEAAWDLADFLQTKQTAYGATAVWFFRLVRVEADYDPEEWGVEAELLLMFENPAVI